MFQTRVVNRRRTNEPAIADRFPIHADVTAIRLAGEAHAPCRCCHPAPSQTRVLRAPRRLRILPRMASAKPSALVDTCVIYCGDNLEQLKRLPAACVDLIYIDPPFNSNRNYEVFWGETKEKRSFEDRHESTRAYIDYMRPRA